MRMGLNRGAVSASAPCAAPAPGTPAAPASQVGSAIIAGHIDSYRGPGVFFRLRQLRPGDRIYIQYADGTLVVFRVYAEHTYAKDQFPMQKVTGPTPDPELRLITCGGTFDAATGWHPSNVVVYAAQIR
jgi:sortase (surface protein transpeptidase)